MAERLTPEAAAQLLRAKAADLIAVARSYMAEPGGAVELRLGALSADIALVAGLLADLYERHDQLLDDIVTTQVHRGHV